MGQRSGPDECVGGLRRPILTLEDFAELRSPSGFFGAIADLAPERQARVDRRQRLPGFVELSIGIRDVPRRDRLEAPTWRELLEISRSKQVVEGCRRVAELEIDLTDVSQHL